MTMLVTGYKSKKELKAAIGSALQYEETSFFGPEYKSCLLYTSPSPRDRG